jgi:hypothetical protein
MSSKTVVILQSSYIPWKGYFDLLNRADEFIFLDDVQFTRRDWRSRNKIKTSVGVEWLTIPVGYNIDWKICDVEMINQTWKSKHKKTITQNYRKAACFQEFKFILDELYDNEIANLSEYNQKVILLISKVLGINNKISDSREYSPKGKSTDRLIDILKKSGATKYLSGPSAKNYLDEKLFSKESIDLEYFSYNDYPEYRQLYGPFVHEVSILDLIFNEGKRAKQFMKTFPLNG